MAPPAQAQVNPPATLPADFDKWDGAPASGAPATLPANFDFNAAPAKPTAPVAPYSAGPASTPSWLDNAESDLKQGGTRTIVGRGLGMLQGRGNRGYAGLESGVSTGVSNFMGSPELGAVHAAQGVAEIPQHPLTGAYHALKGVAEAATIPSMMVAGPTTNAALAAIPSTEHAGALFDDVMQAARSQPVSLNRSMPALERTQQLPMRGANPARVADQLYARANTVNPLTYEEARDFYSNLSQLSASDQMSLSPAMKAALGELKSTFHGDISAAAQAAGKGPEYAAAMKEWSQAKRIGGVFDKAKKYAGKVAGPAILGAAGYGAYKAGRDIMDH